MQSPRGGDETAFVAELAPALGGLPDGIEPTRIDPDRGDAHHSDCSGSTRRGL